MPKLTELQAGRFYTTTFFLTQQGLNFPKMFVDAFRGDVAALPKKINPLPSGMVWAQRFGAVDAPCKREAILDLIHMGKLAQQRKLRL